MYVKYSALYCTRSITHLCNESVLFLFKGREIPLELTLERFNGAKIVYQPDYNNLDSTLAKAFVNKFVVEVVLYYFVI